MSQTPKERDTFYFWMVTHLNIYCVFLIALKTVNLVALEVLALFCFVFTEDVNVALAFFIRVNICLLVFNVGLVTIVIFSDRRRLRLCK